MESMVCRSRPASVDGAGRDGGEGHDVLARHHVDRDAKITCKEAWRQGIAPVRRSHPAYRYMRDRDEDGVVCEKAQTLARTQRYRLNLR